jgi:O-antigen/teichoic acid export membrane protein
VESSARLRRDIAWNLVPVVLLGAVGLGLNFLIGAWWGAAALGVFNQVTTAFFVFSVIAAGGMQYSALRAIAEVQEDPAKVARTAVGALVPTLVLSSLTAFAFILLSHPISRWLDSDDVAKGMRYAGPGLVFFALNKILFGIVNGLRRMRAFAVYTSLRYTLIGVGLIMARVLAVEPAHLGGIWTFSEATLFVVLLVEFASTVAIRQAGGWVAVAREHIAYGARGVLATLAYEVNSKLDVWMLGVATSDKVVGIYSLAGALWEGVIQLTTALQNNFNPVIARSLAAGKTDEVETLVRSARRWFVPLFIAACVIGAASYPFVVQWVIGKHEFIAGAWPFAILMAGAIVASGYLPFNTMLMMGARPGSQTVFFLLVLAVNFALNSLLVSPFGMIGAAIASATALSASALLLRVMIRMRLGVRI